MLSVYKSICFFALLIFVAGCSASSNPQQALTPQPLATPQTATATAVDASGQTALAAESATTPAQNVVDQQLSANTAQGTQVAALDPGKSISFLPVEGMPQSAISSFSQSIKTSAQVHGINLVPSNQPTGKYRVKGYFSALNDGSGTLVTYIWDVVDASGKRLHRINGQDRNGKPSVQPWSTVSNEQLKRMADTTASRLKSWLDSRS